MIGGFIGNPIGGVINVSNIFLAVDTGVYTIAGQTALFNEGVTVTAGAYTISGQPIVFSDKMLSVAGSYALTGQAAAFNDSIAAVAGSYALTGQAALFADQMAVASGSYAVTGQAAVLTPVETVTSGAYAVTGSAITFKLNWVVAAGSYAITGSPVQFSQVINGSGGEAKPFYRGKLELERRKIRITDDEGRARKVDMLRYLKPPPPFTAPAPEWALPDVPDVPPPVAQALPIAPSQPAYRLPESLLALRDAKDENELVEFLTNSPDPLTDHIRHVLGALAASGQLQALLESA